MPINPMFLQNVFFCLVSIETKETKHNSQRFYAFIKEIYKRFCFETNNLSSFWSLKRNHTADMVSYLMCFDEITKVEMKYVLITIYVFAWFFLCVGTH